MIRKGLFIGLILWHFISPVHAQESKKLSAIIADQIQYRGNDWMIAEGNVEFSISPYAYRAAKIEFNRKTGDLFIRGPISQIDKNKNVTAKAESAYFNTKKNAGKFYKISTRSENGDYLSAVEIHKPDQRFLYYYKTVASSCQICRGKKPLWEIRSKLALYDKAEKKVFFKNARLDFGGIPLFYTPRLRIPASDVQRMDGFLSPKIITSNKIGSVLVLPYFLPLGLQRDIKITPYLATGQNNAVALRYRQIMPEGNLNLDLSGAWMPEHPGARYAKLSGTFYLPNDLTLNYATENIKDTGILGNFSQPNKTHETHSVNVNRFKPKNITDFSFTYTNPVDINAPVNSAVEQRTVFEQKMRFYPKFIGGKLDGKARFSSYFRPLETDIIGRDVASLSFDANWSHVRNLSGGFIGRHEIALENQSYTVNQDSNFSTKISRNFASGLFELRLPLSGKTKTADHILQPIGQIVLAPETLEPAPNDDSVTASFDEGNMFSANRFPGQDVKELGTRMNIGALWTTQSAGGFVINTAAGTIFHKKNLNQFDNKSGLSGLRSQNILSLQIKAPNGLSISNRTYFKSPNTPSSYEARFIYAAKQTSLSGSYIWMDKDFFINQSDNISQISLEGTQKLARHFLLQSNIHYDRNEKKMTNFGTALKYTNECITVTIGAEQAYSTANALTPERKYSFGFKLLGFGSNDRSKRRDHCGG